MSVIESILTRAMQEPEFAERLFNDLEAAVADYRLSTTDLNQLEKLSYSNLSSLPTITPEERKSFLTLFAEPGKIEFPNLKIT